MINWGIKYLLNNKEVKKMFGKLKTLLSGKKTYLAAIVTILGVLISWVNGSVEDIEAIKLIIDAILAMTIRAGVAKVQG